MVVGSFHCFSCGIVFEDSDLIALH
jgi:hypothetical protein